MDYWHDILTEKSWKLLQELKKEFQFTLIGGWAVYLWAKTLKSKDIDMIVNFEVLSNLKDRYDLRKNDNLKKYEIKFEEVDVDIYVPFYSKLAIPVEDLETEKIESFEVVKPEYLLILKQGSEIERKDSEKGEKDRIDIVSLLFRTSMDFRLYHKILKKHKIENLLDRLIKIIREFNDYKYLEMTPRQLKLKKQEILGKLKHL